MQSFRTELENNVVAQDIIDLEKKIFLYRNGKMDEERFRSLRLARGVYGQRQLGVQMVRIKIPFGKLNAQKLLRICDISEEYSIGRLHVTTRQDIQIHYVDLDRTPALWAELEKDDITLREACGNTVRNITASATSGIDPNEPFDPRPYADEVFQYFLRNPICQEMGRKFKISFSNSAEDTALSFMHDIGFIAKTKRINGKTIKGFEVWIGGGLGSQPHQAFLYSKFESTEKIIPITEALLRIFERYGERSRRMKARLKFLIKDLGVDHFRQLIADELSSMPESHPIEPIETEVNLPLAYENLIEEHSSEDYLLWKKYNVIEQKDGLYAIGIKLRLGDLYTKQARILSELLKEYSGDEITLTIDQNVLIRHIESHVLYTWYFRLKELGLAEVGYGQANDITACPGTDTCNLGIASSTGLAVVLENVISEEYENQLEGTGIFMKISGCMNSCGQHMIAPIGFQGMSMKAKDKRILPAAQILLGGTSYDKENIQFADKVIKVPSKMAPEALRILLNDYLKNRSQNQLFHEYYHQLGKNYFYDLLKHLGSTDELQEDHYIDWGQDVEYVKAIGVGECAGVVVDLVSTLFFDSEEKLQLAQRAWDSEKFKDSIYHSYASIINTAKALLISEDHKTNSHDSIAKNFQQEFVETGKIELDGSFSELAYDFRGKQADQHYADQFLQRAALFYHKADLFRKKQLAL